MDLQTIKMAVDYGGLFIIALGMFLWLTRVDIPKREQRFQKQTELTLQAFKEEREDMLKVFKEDRVNMMQKLDSLNSAIMRSANTCAINRSLGMVQYLMEKDAATTFEAASLKVREYWKMNGVDLAG